MNSPNITLTYFMESYHTWRGHRSIRGLVSLGHRSDCIL
uniref:Uncharacterized protein n=1 Tax=Arundo donax TaxID=35708 RepID=A0A0A8YUN3_ARUDO